MSLFLKFTFGLRYKEITETIFKIVPEFRTSNKAETEEKTREVPKINGGLIQV